MSSYSALEWYAVLAHLCASPVDAALVADEIPPSDLQLRTLAGLRTMNPDAGFDPLGRLNLGLVADDVFAFAAWLLDAPQDMRDEGARLVESRRRQRQAAQAARIRPIGALAAWQRRVLRDPGTVKIYDDLWRAAAYEQEALEYDRAGFPVIAADSMDRARAICAAAVDREEAA